VTGTAWAFASGVGFGAFQTVNRRAVARMDVYVATLVQLGVALLVLVALVVGTGDRSRVDDLPAAALGWFVLGGLAHFFVGWTLLNISQQRIGAARTSPLISTVPLFGAAVAAVTLGQLPSGWSWFGIALITLGAYVVAAERLLGTSATSTKWLRATKSEFAWRDSVFGFGTALAWAVSPIFIRKGLDGFDSPLIGVTVGLAVSLAGYLLVLTVARHRRRTGALGDAPWLKVTAGVLVALSTWGRWVALERTTVGTVLALGLMSVPIVLLLSPLLMGREVERVNVFVWLGALLVVGGSFVLVVRGR
jgi:drug/metabolite transporter (DMT)-like permease